MDFLTDSFNAANKAKATAPASTAELIDKVKALQEQRSALESGQDGFSLSPALLKKLMANEKLTTDETKLCAALCKSIGYL
jgi:hypothetical protein